MSVIVENPTDVVAKLSEYREDGIDEVAVKDLEGKELDLTNFEKKEP